MHTDAIMPWGKRKKPITKTWRVPEEFEKPVRLRAQIENYPTITAYLKKLGQELRPTAAELRKKGLLRDFEEEDFEQKR